MYMSDIDFDDFVFLKDSNGNLKGGGFTINSGMLLDTISSNEQIGGKKTAANECLEKINHLSIPAGLFYNPKTHFKNHAIKYDNNKEIIDENIYDTLLDLVDPENKKLHSIKTKKNKKVRFKSTRKNKKTI